MLLPTSPADYLLLPLNASPSLLATSNIFVDLQKLCRSWYLPLVCSADSDFSPFLGFSAVNKHCQLFFYLGQALPTTSMPLASYSGDVFVLYVLFCPYCWHSSTIGWSFYLTILIGDLTAGYDVRSYKFLLYSDLLACYWDVWSQN